MTDHPTSPTDRRALLAGIGGLAAGTFLAAGRADAGPLEPPGPPASTGKPLDEVEPRIAVNATNTPGNATNTFEITQPGSYYLTGNITGEAGKNGIRILSENVTLDLMGFNVQGVASALSGIVIPGTLRSITVRNGVVSGWPQRGVDFSGLGFESPSGLFERLHVSNNAQGGMSVMGQSIVQSCVAMQNGQFGFHCQGNVVLRDCLATFSDTGILAGGSCRIENNQSTMNTVGIHVQGLRNVVSNNTIHENTTGLRVTNTLNVISRNTVRSNSTNYDLIAGNQLELLLSELPLNVSWPALIELTGDLTGFGAINGIAIASDHVTIDLKGHALVGTASTQNGIALILVPRHVKICNGTIRGWGGSGIRHTSADEDVSLHHVVENVSVQSNGQFGVRLSGGAIVRNVISSANGSDGIQTGRASIIDSCVAFDNQGFGIGISSGKIMNCVARSNGRAGIGTGSSCEVRDCVSEFNGSASTDPATGIFVGLRSLVVDCVASANTSALIGGVGNHGVGISAGEQSRVVGCLSRGNRGHGVRVTNDCTVENCTVLENGAGSTISAGIFATGSGNRIERNSANGSDFGIQVEGARNFIAGNTASSNTTNFSFVAGNTYGTVVNRTTNATAPSAAVSGDGASSTIASTDAFANIAY